MLALSARHRGRVHPQSLYWKAACCSHCISCKRGLPATGGHHMTCNPVSCPVPQGYCSALSLNLLCLVLQIGSVTCLVTEAARPCSMMSLNSSML